MKEKYDQEPATGAIEPRPNVLQGQATGARPHLFCFGLGYSAQALCEDLAARDWKISGTVRHGGDEKDRLEALGYSLHLFDGTVPLPAHALQGVSHLLSSIPPDEKGDPLLLQMREPLQALTDLQWAGYLSTTGVYGDHDGKWVDEKTCCSPTLARGRARLNAEAAWLDTFKDHPARLNIFRLAGIYGPGRNAFVTLKSGRARRIIKPGQVFGRIHLDDIKAVLLAAIQLGVKGQIYNVADDQPAPPQDVLACAATISGLALPPECAFETAEMSEMARSFYAENKRVSNRRIKEVLGVTLKYPSFKEGLKALWDEDRAG